MVETARKDLPRGRLEGALSKLFTKATRVSALADVADGFRLVTLAGEALQRVAWTPGQKVQLLLGGWVTRTYTPLAWDSEGGSFQLLAYVHGDGSGPGATWARSLELADACAVFGPRGSLDLNALARPAVLFGDEASFGLAHALRFTPAGAQGVHLVLEVTSKPAAAAALDALGVEGAHLVERRADDVHLGEVQEMTAHLLQTRSIQAAVLSGKATSIQRMSKQLRQLGLPRARLQTKAYWAPGKTGLD
jgi:NADPH-dependent ferric siderophore reductase